jgi:hypothetical protein
MDALNVARQAAEREGRRPCKEVHMLIQETAQLLTAAPEAFTGRVTAPEIAAATAMMTEREAQISDGPVFCPQAGGGLLLLALLLASPQEPKETGTGHPRP